ncbi:hypothetical protein [Geothermobacter ehrlichii]|uniref:hypothetical protein n=1 Tax=Geothermobacter ehrlichii TaxID=213224 RepID=UPI0016532509|nr:hypothetical protein [Geothermobacter ehrlichii]
MQCYEMLACLPHESQNMPHMFSAECGSVKLHFIICGKKFDKSLHLSSPGRECFETGFLFGLSGGLAVKRISIRSDVLKIIASAFRLSNRCRKIFHYGFPGAFRADAGFIVGNDW